jgi:hypothetical protein
MTTPRCSTSARRRGDPLVGTAAPATRWLLLEHPGGWAPAALDSAGIPPSVADRLHRAALDVGGRVVLVRRPAVRGEAADRDGERQWAVVDLDGRQQWGTWRAGDDLAAALTALVGGPASQADPTDPNGTADAPTMAPPLPLFLVCTHGRHDVCCAVRGRPVAVELAGRWPDHTWECTHIGGDRFAANVLVVPDGTVYGGLDEGAAVGVIERHLRGQVDTDHLRGFSAHPPPVQAALAAVLAAHGPAAATEVRPGEVVHDDATNSWRVEVLGTGVVPARSTVTVNRTRQPSARLTCRAAADSTAFAWVATLDDVDPRPDP